MLADQKDALIDNLRELVESRHSAAIEAVNALDEYLAANPLSQFTSNTEIPSALCNLVGNTPPHGSIRERVLQCIDGVWKTVAEIAKETQLDKRRIRGVLYAPDLSGKNARKTRHIETTNQLGEKQFRTGRAEMPQPAR